MSTLLTKTVQSLNIECMEVKQTKIPLKTQRSLDIAKEYEDGVKTGALIEKYGISRQRIHAILKSLGIKAHCRRKDEK